MKKFFILKILLLSHYFPCFSQIKFFNGSWAAAQAEAAKSGKPIFVDVYTDWCVPCKKMEQEVFKDPKIGAFMNAVFINFKADAERNGRSLAQEYGVGGYPTLLFVSSEGTLLDRAIGGLGRDAFLAQAQQAFSLTDAGEVFWQLATEWEQGPRTHLLAEHYFKMRQALYMDNDVLLSKWLQALPPDSLALPSVEKLAIQHCNAPQSDCFAYLCARRDAGVKRCANKVEALIGKYISDICANGKESALKEAQGVLSRAYKSNPERIALRQSQLKQQFYLEKKDHRAFMETSTAFLQETWLPFAKSPLFASDSTLRLEYELTLDNIGWQCSEQIPHKYLEPAFLEVLESCMGIVAPSLERYRYRVQIARHCKQEARAKSIAEAGVNWGKQHQIDTSVLESAEK